MCFSLNKFQKISTSWDVLCPWSKLEKITLPTPRPPAEKMAKNPQFLSVAQDCHLEISDAKSLEFLFLLKNLSSHFSPLLWVSILVLCVSPFYVLFTNTNITFFLCIKEFFLASSSQTVQWTALFQHQSTSSSEVLVVLVNRWDPCGATLCIRLWTSSYIYTTSAAWSLPHCYYYCL